ncbi:hypothetical protein [Nocardioides sp. Soil805]|uniref:hypothetical protein n=1 Tax=Nocardioides sp. Soil805 TaxID=1736416 RepID=UPI00070398D2|nr:hypothetical protein [Nocardioides sp. Soil805]KRF34375.1 hypothetical protein ASG94_16905 [Nocardioides sp. Soil805]
MSLELPLSGRLAWWLTAWLRGDEVTDHVLDAVTHGDLGHVVEGLAELTDGSGTTLLDAFVAARRSGADRAGLALPVEGDLLGLGGPRALNDRAVESGEAVVLASFALVPSVVGEVVRWQVLPSAPRQLPDVGEADRALRAALVDSANLLAELDVARWRPEVADRLMNLRHRAELDAPLGVPSRCTDLAARGLQGWAIVDLALEDDGGALSSYEIARRRDALAPLERASRRAVVAACSPEVWPES